MFGIGTGEWLIIAVVLIILFGPKRIPEAFQGLGKGIRSFRKGLSADDDDDKPKNEPPKATDSETKV